MGRDIWAIINSLLSYYDMNTALRFCDIIFKVGTPQANYMQKVLSSMNFNGLIFLILFFS